MIRTRILKPVRHYTKASLPGRRRRIKQPEGYDKRDYDSFEDPVEELE